MEQKEMSSLWPGTLTPYEIETQASNHDGSGRRLQRVVWRMRDR